MRGTVTSIPGHDGEMEVAIGNVRFRLDARRLTRAEDQKEEDQGISQVGYDLGDALTDMDLNLRGWRAEDALMEVDEFLDRALRDGLSSVRIIHGKGTGALRRAVRELLDRHPLAKSFAPEAPDKGGDGVTIVELT